MYVNRRVCVSRGLCEQERVCTTRAEPVRVTCVLHHGLSPPTPLPPPPSPHRRHARPRAELRHRGAHRHQLAAVGGQRQAVHLAHVAAERRAQAMSASALACQHAQHQAAGASWLVTHTNCEFTMSTNTVYRMTGRGERARGREEGEGVSRGASTRRRRTRCVRPAIPCLHTHIPPPHPLFPRRTVCDQHGRQQGKHAAAHAAQRLREAGALEQLRGQEGGRCGWGAETYPRGPCTHTWHLCHVHMHACVCEGACVCARVDRAFFSRRSSRERRASVVRSTSAAEAASEKAWPRPWRV